MLKEVPSALYARICLNYNSKLLQKHYSGTVMMPYYSHVCTLNRCFWGRQWNDFWAIRQRRALVFVLHEPGSIQLKILLPSIW